MSDTALSIATKEPLPASAMLAACAALVLWSGTAIANKVAVAYMGGLTAGVLRSMLAGFIALAIAAAWRMPFPRRNPERLLLAVSGLSSFAAWPALLSVGVAGTTAGNAALLIAMTPVFTVLIGAAANAEPEKGGAGPAAAGGLARRRRSRAPRH